MLVRTFTSVLGYPHLEADLRVLSLGRVCKGSDLRIFGRLGAEVQVGVGEVVTRGASPRGRGGP